MSRTLLKESRSQQTLQSYLDALLQDAVMELTESVSHDEFQAAVLEEQQRDVQRVLALRSTAPRTPEPKPVVEPVALPSEPEALLVLQPETEPEQPLAPIEPIASFEPQAQQPGGPPAHQSGDMFDGVLRFLDQSGDQVETIYRLEQRGGFRDSDDKEVRTLVYERTAAGAAMLRDMLCRAWAQSASPPAKVSPSPLDPSNPRFDPETGSAAP